MELFLAVKKGDFKTVKRLIDKGADVNSILSQEYLDQDVDQEFDIDEDYGSSLLKIACDYRQKKICEFLIKKGADVNEVDTLGSLLIKTIGVCGFFRGELKYEKYYKAKFLLGKYKAEFKKYQICKLLIKNGADVNAKDEYGKTALMFAVQSGYIYICNLLIEKGADVNAKKKWEETALMFASEEGFKEICCLLIENGADLNAKDCDGKTAFLRALDSGHLEICKLLIENGEDIELYKGEISDETYLELETMKLKYDKQRNVSRCHLIKEELMAYVWNPERDFTKWALMDEFSEELKPIGGAGLF